MINREMKYHTIVITVPAAIPTMDPASPVADGTAGGTCIVAVPRGNPTRLGVRAKEGWQSTPRSGLGLRAGADAAPTTRGVAARDATVRLGGGAR